MGRLTLAGAGRVALLLASAAVTGPAQGADEATALVRRLGGFAAEIDGRLDKGTRQSTPAEQRRKAIHVRLRALDGEAIPALRQGLADPDVHVRRHVALYLAWEGGNHARNADTALDVRPFLPQLVAALRDGDQRVMELAAQALAHAGSPAATAVPDLVRLLEDRREGLRNSACIALAGIGPSAREALPALRRALQDPRDDVRRFAQWAIGKIERRGP